MNPARPVLAAGLLAVLAAWSATASAQQIYRIVGPDGRVTFSDRPPPDASARAAPVVTLPAASPDAGLGSLPQELRAAASRFPVTLYARPGCVPCEQGRRILSIRGIPYNERTVTTNEDIEALARLTGAQTLPVLTVGSQQLRGFSEVEWGQFLDAAGYPRVSVLPPSYRQPAAAPLVTAASAAPPVPGQATQGETPAAAAPPPSGPNPGNPAGIQF